MPESIPDERSIRSTWEALREAMIPIGAPDVQVREMRRAYYAGAYTILMMGFHLIGGEGVDKAEAIALLVGWRAECEAFFDRLKRGIDER